MKANATHGTVTLTEIDWHHNVTFVILGADLNMKVAEDIESSSIVNKFNNIIFDNNLVDS